MVDGTRNWCQPHYGRIVAIEGVGNFLAPASNDTWHRR